MAPHARQVYKGACEGGRPELKPASPVGEERADLQKAYGAGAGIDYDLTVFVPRLREEGIPEDAIEDMLVNNPARLFAIENG